MQPLCDEKRYFSDEIPYFSDENRIDWDEF